MSAVVALCAGASVMAQVNDAAPDAGAIGPDRQIQVSPESLGDPVAGPFNVELGANITTYGVVHAFGHYWVTASRRDPIAHAIWKFDEDGRFIKAFEQAPQTMQSSVGYRDGAADEGANQIYFIWGNSQFAIHEYDPATGDLSFRCLQQVGLSSRRTSALARTPRGTLLTKLGSWLIFEFDEFGTQTRFWSDPTPWPGPGFVATGCAYDAASDSYWWATGTGIIVETDANMEFTGRRFDGAASFTSFTGTGGLDIYADARSPSGDAFVMLGQGFPDEIAAYEAPAGASEHNTTGPIGCKLPLPALVPCYLETIFGANSSGSVGGVVYMDLTIGDDDLTILGLDLNTSLDGLDPFQIELWTRPGGYVGGECNVSEWTLVAIGNGSGRGLDAQSRVIFRTPLELSAGETVGVALVAVGADHQFTIGNGSNENYSDNFMSVRLGAADDVPFSQCAPPSPSVWNGRFYYRGDTTLGCIGCPGCACEFDPIPDCNIHDLLAFQNLFVMGNSCAVDLDTSTGIGVGDIFDWLVFQNSFLSGGIVGCP